MVDNSIFLAHVSGHEKNLYCIMSLEVSLYAYFVASVHKFFTKSSYVWHYVYIFVVGVPVIDGTGWIHGDCMWILYVAFVVDF